MTGVNADISTEMYQVNTAHTINLASNICNSTTTSMTSTLMELGLEHETWFSGSDSNTVVVVSAF